MQAVAEAIAVEKGADATDASSTSSRTEESFARFLARGKSPHDYERRLMQEHFNRIIYILNGGNPPPYELEIQPSSACNVKCRHCFGRNYQRLFDLMHHDDMDNIADNVMEFKDKDFGIDVVKFCGTTGEPLVNPATLYGIELFKGIGKKVIVFTNGLLLDKRARGGRQYLDYVLLADKLNLSLDAASEKTFNELKGCNEFSRIIKNLKKLAEKRNRNDSRLYIALSFVIGKENYKEIVEAARLAKNIGADEISYRVDFTGTGKIRKLSKYIIPSLRLAEKFGSNERFKVSSIYSDSTIKEDDLEFNSCGRRCFNCRFWACIGPNCELYACGHRTHAGVESYGSLFEHTLRELWSSNKRLGKIKALPDEHCMICSPSSSRRNDFMSFLSQMQPGSIHRLYKKYIKEQ